MQAATISGFAMTVVGVTTVFLALALLVVVLSIVARVLGQSFKGPGEASAVPAAPAPASSAGSAPAAGSDAGADAGSEATLRAVALAAYGLHRRRRVTVPTPPAASAWRLGGRAAQMRRAWR